MTSNTTQAPSTRKEIAEWLGVAPVTIRSWDSYYSHRIESEKGVKGQAKKRIYTRNDLITFSAIKSLRNQNRNLKEIEELLDGEIQVTHLPEWGVVDSSEISSLVVTENKRLTSQLMQASNELAGSQARLETVVDERDRLLDEIESLRERNLQSEVELGILKSKSKSWWERLFSSSKTSTIS